MSEQQTSQNVGVTTYNPDAIESCQFTVSRNGDLLVGISGKELVGYAIEKSAPSTSFFHEEIDQVARCVCICSCCIVASDNGNGNNNNGKSDDEEAVKEWIVAVGGDAKFVDLFRVTLAGHIILCHAEGRIGPFPKRIQSLTMLHDAKNILLVADRFGDVYHCNLIDDAQAPMSRNSSSFLGVAAANNSSSGNNQNQQYTQQHPQPRSTPSDSALAAFESKQQQQQQGKNDDNNDGDEEEQGGDDSPKYPHLRFALQHLGLITLMHKIPCQIIPSEHNNNMEDSPLLLTCDSDFHVRISCARRPGLLLQNLWKNISSVDNNNSNNIDVPANDSGVVAAAATDSYFTSQAGAVVSCSDYFAQQKQQQSESTIVVGRCDGTLSIWTLSRHSVEQLHIGDSVTLSTDLQQLASSHRSSGSSSSNNTNNTTPIVGVACLSLKTAVNVVVFAKADSSHLYAWRPSVLFQTADAAMMNYEEDLHQSQSQSQSQNQNQQSPKNNNNRRREAPDDATSSSSSSKDHFFQLHCINNNEKEHHSHETAPPIVQLFACPHISKSAVLVVYRDSTVELFDIQYNTHKEQSSCSPERFHGSSQSQSQSQNQSQTATTSTSATTNRLSCQSIKFPASGSHVRLPLPFSSPSKEIINRAKSDAIFSIVQNVKLTKNKNWRERQEKESAATKED